MSQRVFSDTATAASSISVDPSATATGGSGGADQESIKRRYWKKTPNGRYQRPLYVAATRQHVGKTTVSLAVLSGLQKRFDKIGAYLRRMPLYNVIGYDTE